MKTEPGLRFSLRQRRLAAVHEAGHAVITASVGLRVQTWIWPTYPLGEEIYRRGRRNCTSILATRARSLGAQIGNWQDSMSEFDWKSIGCEAGKPDAECRRAAKRVIAKLDPGGALGGRLCQMARDIIIASRTATPDDAAPELVEKV